LITVVSSIGISISMETSFLSSVNLLRPNLGLFSLSLALSSLLNA
jgi:hypothetical protein